MPSFELWLLLHYADIQSPIRNIDLMRQLRKNFPSYEKGINNAFSTTRDRLDTAIKRAEILISKFSAYNATDPYTNVVELVNFLIKMHD